MKTYHMLKSYISLLIVFTCSFSLATNNKLQNDTLNKFGIRAGIDIQKIIISATNKEYNGLSINADIRIKKSLYISSEIGNEEKMTNTDYIRSTSKGNYIKFGTKFKLNKNLKGNQNLTYSGANLGYSSFNQTINSYTIYIKWLRRVYSATWPCNNIWIKWRKGSSICYFISSKLRSKKTNWKNSVRTRPCIC